MTLRPIQLGLRTLFLLLALATVQAVAQTKTKARITLSHEVARPGETVWAAVTLSMPQGWHTYWRFGGDTGGPTEIRWNEMKGLTPGDILWPVPEKDITQGITTFVYHKEVPLLVPLVVDPAAAPGTVTVSAKVDWLECADLCVPGSGRVSTTLQIGAASKVGPGADLIEKARARLPLPGESRKAMAGLNPGAQPDTMELVIEWELSGPAESLDFFPYGGTGYEVGLAAKVLTREGGKARIQTTLTRSGTDWPKQLQGLLMEHPGGGAEARAFEVVLALEGADSAAPTASAGATGAPSAPPEKPPGLLEMLWYGFLGGIILNIMPCVFPVIALKILGFVNQSGESRRRVFHMGLVYSLGVLVSFLVLAAFVLAVKKASGGASWGMQMQNPQFTLGLTALVTLVALNLFGVFEVNLSSGAMGAAGDLAAKEGFGGAFMNGVLATVLATPCTAPFLAPALGFAFAQPAPVIVLMFATVALGLSLPYLVLSWNPSWLRFLPRPGKWMEYFKVAMGFPMLATAFWLFSFSAARFGADGTLWFGVFLVLLGLAAWIWGEFVQRGRKNRPLAIGIAVAVLATGYFYVLESELDWRNPPAPAAAGSSAAHRIKGGIEWESWSPDAVAAAVKAGRPVLVDFTARWCLSCKANKKTSMEIDSVRSRIKQLGVAPFLADYTDKDPRIGAEFAKYGRAGVPLVLVYSKNPAVPPRVLPTLLTPGIVLEALDWAAR